MKADPLLLAYCVLKVSSHDITHKSDAGGIKVGLKDGAEVAIAYRAIMANCRAAHPDAVIEGVTVQTMTKPGAEVIVGMARAWRAGCEGAAERRGTTLNAQFRIWLANYVEQEKVAHDYRQLMKQLDYARSAGPYTRDELNER